MFQHRSPFLPTAIAALMVALVATASTVPVVAQNEESAAADATSGEAATSGDAATDASGPQEAAASGSVERGRYLAHEVAMCVQCHSPRDRRGELLRNRLFEGAPIPVESPWFGSPRWAFHAPTLEDVPGYTEEQFIEFLTTGLRPNGTEARGPMPPFRMNEEDARAVWDYLRSL